MAYSILADNIRRCEDAWEKKLKYKMWRFFFFCTEINRQYVNFFFLLCLQLLTFVQSNKQESKKEHSTNEKLTV